MTRSSSVLIVLVSVVLSVGVSRLLPRDARPAPASGEAPAALLAIEALEARISRLEEGERGRAAALVSPELPETPTPERVPVTNGGTETADLLEKLAVLERRLALVEYDEESPSLDVEPAQAEREHADLVLAAQWTLADPAAGVAEKLAAHEALRRVADAYTPAMVADLVHIGTNEPDARMRADVWRFFDGSTHLPDLVPHLLAALEFDVDALVRDEASETLGNYADAPAVLEALRFAAEHDESQRVRTKAQRTLGQLTAWIPENR